LKPKFQQAQQAYLDLKAEFGQFAPGGVHGPFGPWWGEPAPPYPQSTALPSAAPVIDLSAPATVKVLLKAQVPAVVRLRGRPDLLFRRAGITLTALPLQRNLAAGTWGTAVSEVVPANDDFSRAREYLFSGPQRLTALAAAPATEVQFRVREGGRWRTIAPVQRFYLPAPNYTVVDQAVETDAVQVLTNTEQVAIVLLSESAPMRLMLAAGDDTPLQSFPSAVPAGERVASRDLAGDLNRAWAGALPAGDGLVEIPIKITSLTDGLVEASLAGEWARSRVENLGELVLNPLAGQSVEVPWLPDATSGAVTVVLEGDVGPGLRWGLAEQAAGGRAFAVRVSDNLAIAQAVLLRAGGGTGPARAVTAVWLALPDVPAQPQTVELQLCACTGEPATPAEGAPLARAEATLPADTTAYLAAAPGGPGEPVSRWFRVPFARPVALNGTAAGEPLFVVCSGREGSLLAHRSVAAAGRLPGAPGPGTALVRNLAWASDWEEQRFDTAHARWLFDLELAPQEGEAPLTLGGQPVTLAGGAGEYQASIAVQSGSPVPPAITLPLSARAGGTVKLTTVAAAPA
jgi:hypothetical protein